MVEDISWKLYYHKEKSKGLAEFMKELSVLSKYENVETIAMPNQNKGPAFAKLPRSLRELLFFGHPDVVLTMDNKIQPVKTIFAWEITDAKPATDHWMQRFPSLVGATELDVPSVFIMRFESNTEKWSQKLKSEFFYAYDRVMEIHQIPIYIANWEPSKSGNLSTDSKYPDVPDRSTKSMKESIEFLNKVIDYASHGKEPKNLMRERLIVELRDKLRLNITETPQAKDYKRLTTVKSDGYLNWKDASNYMTGKSQSKLPEFPERITRRDRNLIFVPRPLAKSRKNVESLFERIKKKNGNPYNGMPLAFDFMFCRLGNGPYERDVNFIIDLSELSYKQFSEFARNVHNSSPIGKTSKPVNEEIPRYSLHLTSGYVHEIKDFIRQYCYAADIIILSDLVIPFIIG